MSSGSSCSPNSSMEDSTLHAISWPQLRAWFSEFLLKLFLLMLQIQFNLSYSTTLATTYSSLLKVLLYGVGMPYDGKEFISRAPYTSSNPNNMEGAGACV